MYALLRSPFSLSAWIKGAGRRIRRRIFYYKSLKWYLYVSESKVNQLYEQIGAGLFDKIEGEVKLGVKGMSLTANKKDCAKSTLAKLTIVERYLTETDQIGTVEKTKIFFRGYGDMKWGTTGEHGDLVFFCGRSADGFVTLGGSTKHVFGGMSKNGQEWSPYIKILSWLKDEAHRLPENSIWPHLPVSNDVAYLFNLCQMFYEKSDCPPQFVEFVAIKYLEGEYYGKNAVLGSPLYVALYS